MKRGNSHELNAHTPPFRVGGNQREVSRERAAKRAAAAPKKGKAADGLTATQRKERDAEIMREKQAKKAAAAAAGGKKK